MVQTWLDHAAHRHSYNKSASYQYKSNLDKFFEPMPAQFCKRYSSFLAIDRTAITRNATPASHKLLVKNQTIKAMIAAGINIKMNLTTKISISKPIPIRIMRAMSSRRSYPMKVKENNGFKTATRTA
jgi:hypothetical protein